MKINVYRVGSKYNGNIILSKKSVCKIKSYIMFKGQIIVEQTDKDISSEEEFPTSDNPSVGEVVAIDDLDGHWIVTELL